MPTGRPARCEQHGFTYLLLLVAVALGSAGLAALATRWSTVTQRQLEFEQISRGTEIAAAIGRWRQRHGQGPRDLEDLLEDRQDGVLVRELRRIRIDPVTGQADWVLLRDDNGHIEAVRSRSTRPALIVHDLAATVGEQARLQDRIFRAAGVAVTPSAPM